MENKILYRDSFYFLSLEIFEFTLNKLCTVIELSVEHILQFRVLLET